MAEVTAEKITPYEEEPMEKELTEKLHGQAIRSLKSLLMQELDYQQAIEQVFNDSDRFSPLFEGMEDDERFEKAYTLLQEAEMSLDEEAWEIKIRGEYSLK